MPTDPRMGRLYVPDERDAAYPMQSIMPRGGGPVKRFWRDDLWLGDQGFKPYCVGYAWVHWLETEPVTHDLGSPAYSPDSLYHDAQRVDAWPGENYDGTSVRAGAKVLRKLGFIKNYYWATRVWEIANAIRKIGPVVVGTAWYSGMTNPNRYGRIRPTGRFEGGHAYLLSGVNCEKKFFRVRNSWGLDWGKKGRARITFKDFKRLLADNGEACIATEVSMGG